MKINRNLHAGMLLASLCLFNSCDDHKLKPPRENTEESSDKRASKGLPIDREFARELAREFAKEFAREFSQQFKDSNASIGLGSGFSGTPIESNREIGSLANSEGKPHPLLAHCAEDVFEFYQSHPDCFSIKTRAEIPQGLNWQDGADEEEFSSPDAQKGGTWNVFMRDFPRTLRTIGPDANGAFRSYLLDYNALSLVMAHPNSDGYYPGLAESWAVAEDKRTVYFRLDSDAKYSDGQPVRTSDFFFFFYFMRSKHIQAPWYNDFYGKDKFLNITLFDSKTFSITFFKAKPDVVERVSLRPIPEYFYGELGGEYLNKYQWLPEPSTGPYVASPENVDKGKSVTLVRQNNWWADQKKFYRYRFNPSKIKVSVVRDYNKAFEIFLKGGIDMFGLAKTEFWYEKLTNNHELVANGYLSKVTFFNQTPPPSYALRINSQSPPLDNRNIRIGFHHAMNFDLIIEKIFRGDYLRMNTVADGYGARSHPTLRARDFSVEKAVEYFSKAGYSKRGSDGILVNNKGEKLSVEILTGYKHFEDVLVVLKEEAKKAGLEIKLKILESTSAWKAAGEKNHQVIFSAFNSSVELFPRFWEPFHSDNAYQESGDTKFLENGRLKLGLIVKTSTNNFTQTAVREIDHLINEYREEESLERITELAHQLSQMIHDHGVWVPAWKKPWLRIGHWNWIKFPTDWGPKETRDYEEFQVFWIDQSKKEEILKAKEAGNSLSDKPIVRVYDKYKSN